MKSKPSRLALLVLPAILLAACATASAPTAAPAGGRDASLVGGDPGFAVGAPNALPEAQRTDVKAASGNGAPAPIPVPQAFDPDRALILTANVSLKAKDAWSVADRVQSIALGLGGDVMSLAQSGSGEHRSATLTVRVPQARFNDALRQVREIADIEVLTSNVDGKDVTDQFVDLQARLTAKKAEEQRYLALLARAEKIEDILRIDSVLSQVRTQIEQLTAQVNSIKARTTYSTIVVQISPVGPLPVPTPDPKAYDPSKTVERAVTALVSLLRYATDAAIWALVFGWIPLVLFGLVLLMSRTRARMAPTS
ncbi:MAG: DUF4349 domain-containing protein [Chloroflexi bacterium]|nr:DUF4349 domain-containing protein [Chloroflexota bacterium]